MKQWVDARTFFDDADLSESQMLKLLYDQSSRQFTTQVTIG